MIKQTIDDDIDDFYADDSSDSDVNTTLVAATSERVQKSIATFNRLKTEAYSWEYDYESVPSGWQSIELDNGVFSYDPDRIEIQMVSASNECNNEELEAFLARTTSVDNSWKFLGNETYHGNNKFYARPFLREVGLDIPSNVDLCIAHDSDLNTNVNAMDIGNMHVQLAPVYLSADQANAYYGGPIEHPEETVEISIFRREAIKAMDTIDDMIAKERSSLNQHYSGKKSSTSQRRQSELHNRKENILRGVFQSNAGHTSFKKELDSILRTLKQVGYTTFVAHPSDARRRRIYLKLGMESLNNSDALIGNISNILANL